MRPHEYIELYGGRPGLHCLPLLNPNIGVRAGRKLRLEMWAGTLEFFEDEDAEAQIAKQKEAAARAAAAEAVAAAAVARGRRTLRKALSQTFSKKSSRGLAE